MKKPKFKPGDHVIVLRDDMFPSLVDLTGTILEWSDTPYIRLDDQGKYPSAASKQYGKIAVRDCDIELSELHHSPLYQALL